VSADGTKLDFDGLILNPPDVADGGVTPLSAPLFALKSLIGGHINSISRETLDSGEAIIISVLDDAGDTQSILIDAESGIPLTAELYSGDSVAVYCEFSNWSMT